MRAHHASDGPAGSPHSSDISKLGCGISQALQIWRKPWEEVFIQVVKLERFYVKINQVLAVKTHFTGVYGNILLGLILRIAGLNNHCG